MHLVSVAFLHLKESNPKTTFWLSVAVNVHLTIINAIIVSVIIAVTITTCVIILVTSDIINGKTIRRDTMIRTAQAMAMAIISPSMRNVTTPEAVLNP